MQGHGAACTTTFDAIGTGPLDLSGTRCTVFGMDASYTPPVSFAELIELWPSIADFAEETKQPYMRAKRWRTLNDGRGSIHPKYWPAVKAAAWKRGWGWVDDTLLARLAVNSAAEHAA